MIGRIANRDFKTPNAALILVNIGVGLVMEGLPQAQKGKAVTAHSVGGWILMGVLVLHIAGALKHQWIDKHPELARMGIGRR